PFANGGRGNRSSRPTSGQDRALRRDPRYIVDWRRLQLRKSPKVKIPNELRERGGKAGDVDARRGEEDRSAPDRSNRNRLVGDGKRNSVDAYNTWQGTRDGTTAHPPRLA